MTPCSCLRSVSVSACPCFITRSWWITGLITDGCQWVRHTARARPQNNRDVLSSALPGSQTDPDTTRRVAWPGCLNTRHRAEQEKLNSSSLINDLVAPAGAQCLGQKTWKWEMFMFCNSYIRYCIRILISDLFSKWFVIPLVVSARVF